MKKCAFPLLLALCLGLPSDEAAAHTGDRLFPIFELPTADLPDLHDSTLEDWEAVLPSSSLDHNDFVFLTGDGGRVNPDDLAFRVFLAWHSASQRLFVAVEWIDDVYVSPIEQGAREGFQFMVDGDHSGGQYAQYSPDDFTEAERRQLSNNQAQFYWAQYEPWEGRVLFAPFQAPDQLWMLSSPWVDVGGFQAGETPYHGAGELAVTPWDDLQGEGLESSRRSLLAGGRVIGFQISVFDTDRENQVQGIYSLSKSLFGGGGDHQQTADAFVDGELIPCDINDCGAFADETAVQVNSWARIKASFAQ